MSINNLKQPYKSKKFKITTYVILVLIIILYYKAFFTLGVYFNDAFLMKEIINEEVHYTGKTKYGDIKITVKGKLDELKESHAEVIYNLPNDNNQVYHVYYNNKEQWHLGYIEVKDDRDNILFEGRYVKGSLFLYNQNNEPLIDEYLRSAMGNDEKVTYDSYYSVPIKTTIELSMHEKETLRGNVNIMLSGLVILIIVIIDIKSPLFFFTLSHCLYVDNPQPSEFYLAVQRIGWIVYPIIAIVFLVVAI